MNLLGVVHNSDHSTWIGEKVRELKNDEVLGKLSQPPLPHALSGLVYNCHE